MKIILNETKKEGILIKNDCTEISRYSYKNLINDEFTFEQFKQDIDRFNVTLSQQDEFDDIKELVNILKIHSF